MSDASGRAWRAREPEAYKRARSKYIALRRSRVDVLKAAPCVDCGGRFPPECMDFDHVRGEKAAKVSYLIACRPERLAEEVAKCDLVCANCHRIRTRQRMERLA